MKYIFVTILYFALVNAVVASEAVIWQQELICDSNLTCQLGAIVVDNKSNELIILGTSKQPRVKEANFWLWKIDPNGSVKDRKLLGPLSQYDFLMVGPLGIKATVKPDTGDIIRLNVFDDANSTSLSITDRNMQSRSVKLDVRRKQSETFLLHDMISCQNDNLLFVGQEGMNGILIKTDLSGNTVWKKVFDLEQTEILSSVACAPDGKDYYAVGLSVKMAGKITFAGPATICLLRYDSNGELKASDFFEGGLAPWPTSLPKVICLPSGIVLVVYDRSKNGVATELYVKSYTPELTPLGEKLILKTNEDGPPASYDVCATVEDRFAFAGVINYSDLRIYECDADGTNLQTLELDATVAGTRLFVDYLDEKIFVTFAKKLQGDEKESKIRLLAIKPYKAN